MEGHTVYQEEEIYSETEEVEREKSSDDFTDCQEQEDPKETTDVEDEKKL